MLEFLQELLFVLFIVAMVFVVVTLVFFAVFGGATLAYKVFGEVLPIWQT